MHAYRCMASLPGLYWPCYLAITGLVARPLLAFLPSHCRAAGPVRARPAPQYWCLAENANMRDLILAVRADEACHSHVNHHLKVLNPDDPNPFAMGKSQQL